jgi:hypothetical protein
MMLFDTELIVTDVTCARKIKWGFIAQKELKIYLDLRWIKNN